MFAETRTLWAHTNFFLSPLQHPGFDNPQSVKCLRPGVCTINFAPFFLPSNIVMIVMLVRENFIDFSCLRRTSVQGGVLHTFNLSLFCFF